jgi:hypothetical protein
MFSSQNTYAIDFLSQKANGIFCAWFPLILTNQLGGGHGNIQ